MADERYAFVVAVVGAADVMSPHALERLIELLVNRHADARKICLVSCGWGPELQWCQNRGWMLIFEPDNSNRMKRDCSHPSPNRPSRSGRNRACSMARRSRRAGPSLSPFPA